MSNLPSVVHPGDVIQSDLINSILTRLTALETQLQGTVALRVGSMAANAHTLLAIGAGFTAGGGIYLDGAQQLNSVPSRGINLAIFDPATLARTFTSTYDTYNSTSESARLVSELPSHGRPGD